MRPVTLITGASSGIGAELAHVFAEHGHELVLTARREAELEALAGAIAAAGHARPLVLPLDLVQRDAVARLAAALTASGVEPDNVVNNAGFGLAGDAAALDRDDQLAMIDLNMRALTELSLAFADSLARHRGGLLNVASIAGFLPGPGMAVYYASKAYVLSFSEALHQELKTSRRARHRAVPGAGGHRLPGSRRLAGRGHRGGRSPGTACAPRGRDRLCGTRGGKRVVVAGLGNKLAVSFMGMMPHALLVPLAAYGMRRAGRF